MHYGARLVTCPNIKQTLHDPSDGDEAIEWLKYNNKIKETQDMLYKLIDFVVWRYHDGEEIWIS